MHGNYSLLRSAGLDPPIGIYSFILVRYIDYIPTTSVSVIDTVIYLHFFFVNTPTVSNLVLFFTGR